MCSLGGKPRAMLVCTQNLDHLFPQFWASPGFPTHSPVPRVIGTRFLWPEKWAPQRVYLDLFCSFMWLALHSRQSGEIKERKQEWSFPHHLFAWSSDQRDSIFFPQGFRCSYHNHCHEVPDWGHSCVTNRKRRGKNRDMPHTSQVAGGPLSCFGWQS